MTFSSGFFVSPFFSESHFIDILGQVDILEELTGAEWTAEKDEFTWQAEDKKLHYFSTANLLQWVV